MKDKTESVHILSDKKTIMKLRNALQKVHKIVLEYVGVDKLGSWDNIFPVCEKIEAIAKRALKATDMSNLPKAKNKSKKKRQLYQWRDA